MRQIVPPLRERGALYVRVSLANHPDLRLRCSNLSNNMTRRFKHEGDDMKLAVTMAVVFATGISISAGAIEHKVLATSKTSTMEKELNEAAEAGYRFQQVMGGESAIGGKEVIVVMTRTQPSTGRYGYKLLGTSKTSTMQKELQEASDGGFAYRGQTVFSSTFGGDEVVVILERDKDGAQTHYDYKLTATTKTSTLEKELSEAGGAGYELVGMTVGKTALGGKELIAITRKVRP
jgi:hypothetical protein